MLKKGTDAEEHRDGEDDGDADPDPDLLLFYHWFRDPRWKKIRIRDPQITSRILFSRAY